MSQTESARRGEPRRFVRTLLLIFGITLGQFVLYGPSLVGNKVLLPLDILAGEGFYLPQQPGAPKFRAEDGTVSDLVLQFEPARRFAVAELKAGRMPTWASYGFAGAPFIWPKFSPFLLIECCSQAPIVLAWSQFFLAIVAGLGAYRFFRDVLELRFWPSAIAAWCYPLTAFFVLWEGFPLLQPVAWFPWLLSAIDVTIRDKSPLRYIGLALVTCLILSGQLDLAGQVLLASGLYATWRLFAAKREKEIQTSTNKTSLGPLPFLTRFIRRVLISRRAILRLIGGWVLGFLLAAPYLFPVLTYSHTGARMMRRGAGVEERPPLGVIALPQIALPDIFGIQRQPGLRYAGGFPQQESSAAGYAGVTALLLAAPLGFTNRRLRNFNLLWVFFFIIGLSWCLAIPGIVNLLRLPGLNMMSHNRLVFMSGFATLALAASGLDTFSNGVLCWRRWMWLPFSLLIGLCTWCAYRILKLPEPIATGISSTILNGGVVEWVHDLSGVRRLQQWFVAYYSGGAVFCGFGALSWVLLRSKKVSVGALISLLGLLLTAELIWFGYGRAIQSEPALYYPPVPSLKALTYAPPGRVMGYACLPATLSAICGLHDIRGYDAVDPARLVELELSASEMSSYGPRYAATMRLAPRAKITPEGNIQLPPVLDMLNVRYVIFRGVPFPKAKPLFQSEDYWVLDNPKALPRAFVPRRVEVITNDAVRLQKIESDDFNPREVAFVESAVELPNSIEGTAEITDEIPTRVNVAVDMKTPGMVVLADLWDKGWSAYLNGTPVPILRANHAVRGVVVGPGKQMLQFRYVPAGFALGLKLAGAAAVVLLACLIIGVRQSFANKSSSRREVLSHEERHNAG